MTYIAKKAFILIGASGSGKSTVTRTIQEHFIPKTPMIGTGPTTAVFSLDACRLEYYAHFLAGSGGQPSLVPAEVYRAAFDYCNEQAKEFEVFVEEVWKAASKTPVIIIDNVNSTRKSRAKWVQKLRQEKYHITMVEVQTPLDIILARQSTRGDKNVPVEAVKTQFLRQESAMVGSECDNVIIIDGTKPWQY